MQLNINPSSPNTVFDTPEIPETPDVDYRTAVPYSDGNWPRLEFR